MTDPRHFSAKTKRQAWKRSRDHCEKCTAKLTTGNIIYDHVIPWEISGDSSLENCQTVCLRCDAAKTYGTDIPTIAKVRRIYDAAHGIERLRKKMPGHRKDRISKKVCGTVVLRQPRYSKHHAALRNRQIGGGE